LNLTHSNLPDLDVHLVSPAGNDNGLFSDLAGGPTLNLRLDDEAAVPLMASVPTIGVYSGVALQPERDYRLSWFDGEDAGGDWRLDVRDDATGNGGTLNSWSLTICEMPPVCLGGTTPSIFFNQDFEANDGDFTSTGTTPEWEWGTPPVPPIDSCNDGTRCWKTALSSGTYSPSTSQDLVSPPISLVGRSGTLVATWAQKYQMRDAALDHIFVEARQAGGANPKRLLEHVDGTMRDLAIGNPSVDVEESAGWGLYRGDVSNYAGQNLELRFHLDSNSGAISEAGFAIDSVTITQCLPSGPLVFMDGFESGSTSAWSLVSP
jgi:hypothetical protein